MSFDASGEAKSSNKYGMIVLDAFGSDSVPIHLMTAEAIELYFDLMDDDGLLVLHISNKFIKFEPVVAALAERFGVHGISKLDSGSSDPDLTGHQASHYAILTRNSAVVQRMLDLESGWKTVDSEKKILWTDEHANILDAMKW